MKTTTTSSVQITSLPFRLEPFGGRGYTVREFASAKDAAAFVAANPDAAMPCWRRFSVVGGELLLTS